MVATDHVGNAESKSPLVESQTRISTRPWQNALNPLDVDGDEFAVAGDALTIINYLNTFGSQVLPGSRPEDEDFLDPNGDGSIAADDALEIINDINSRPGPEGESFATDDSPAAGTMQPLPPTNGTLDDLVQLLAMDVASLPKRGDNRVCQRRTGKG